MHVQFGSTNSNTAGRNIHARHAIVETMLTMTVESDEELNMKRPDDETIMQLMMPTCPVH